MIDLTTKYLGLKLKNPVVASAGPLTKDLKNFRRLEDAGVAAIVMHSLFEEQINLESNELDRFLAAGSDLSPEATYMFPDMAAYNIGPEGYLEQIRRAKAAVKVPIIGSLNGVSTGGWIEYAQEIEQAGADALELNIYYMATDPRMDAATVEKMYCELVEAVKQSITIPVAVKIGPYFSAMANMAKQLGDAGADGLVLFNRFYQPDLDLDEMEVVPSLQLSRSNELRVRLHWVALLYGRILADMAITGGIHTAEDVIKSMMVGARVAMITSALLEHGPDYVRFLVSEVRDWMEKHEYESIRQMQGSMSAKSVRRPAAFERANYMKVLSHYSLTPVRR